MSPIFTDELVTPGLQAVVVAAVELGLAEELALADVAGLADELALVLELELLLLLHAVASSAPADTAASNLNAFVPFMVKLPPLSGANPRIAL